MESTQLQSAATGMRRENESMDDFEHLEVESSPVKENMNEKLTSKEPKAENTKSDQDPSVLIRVPDGSRNSSDFSFLSDSKLDSPLTDSNTAFTIESATNKLHDLTATLERKKSPTDEMSELQGYLAENGSSGSKTDPKTASKSFLATETLGEGFGQFKEISGANVDDLLHFESKTPDDLSHKVTDMKGKLQPMYHCKDDDDFKDLKPVGTISSFPAEIGMGDMYRDVQPDVKPNDKPIECLPEGANLAKYKTDDDDEVYNLAASQDSSPIRIADKLEQYNIKPNHDPFLKSEQSTDKAESLETDEYLKVEETVKDYSKQPARSTSPVGHVIEVLEFSLDSWFRPERLHPKVESLVYWRNPKISGAVLCMGLALLLSLTYCSLISVIAYVSLGILVGSGGFRLYRVVLAAVNKTGEGHPFRDLLDKDIAVSSDRAASLAQQIVPHINASVMELRRLFLVEDILDSIKFGVMLWVLTYLGAIFNGLTLVILAFVSAFTLPRLYENNKPQIDRNIELVRAKIAEITAKVQAFNPLSGAAAKKLAGTGSEDKKEN